MRRPGTCAIPEDVFTVVVLVEARRIRTALQEGEAP